jgi:hemolysin activation/secretion protein
MRTHYRIGGTSSAIAMVIASQTAAAQTTLDRVDPAKIEAKETRDAKPAADVSPPTSAPASAPAGPAATPVTVGAITLTGLEVLRPSDFADIFDLYVGRTLSPGALAGLTDALVERARARGFVLASATIPAQPLTAGILRVEINEGRLDAVRLRGGTNSAVEAALRPLVGRGPVRLTELERRLLIAGDIDGIWLRRSRVVEEGGRRILEVDIRPDRFAATLGLDNSGSRPIGPIQADMVLRASQLLAPDDLLTITQLLTPTEPAEFGYLRARYSKRVSPAGTELAISASLARTQPGSYLSGRGIEGTSWTLRAEALHPLLRRRDASLWLSGELGLRRIRQDRFDLLARRDRLTVARVGVNGFAQVAGGRLRAGATLSQGLDLFDATRFGDPLASRRDADGTFTAVGTWGDWTRAITATLTGHVAVASQLAAQPLLVSEEVGLGGGSFLRAYDYSERSGDRGTMASAELRWVPVPQLSLMRKPQLYAFVDGGRVTNLRGGFGSGTLFSAGVGVRTAVARLADLDVGYAVPLSGPRYDVGRSTPVVNLRLSLRL